MRERVVGELRLLQAQHVGARVAEPLLDPRLTRLQRVDVPGRDAHPATLSADVRLRRLRCVVSASARSASRSIWSAGATATRTSVCACRRRGADAALEHRPLAEDRARPDLGDGLAVDRSPTSTPSRSEEERRRPDRPAGRGTRPCLTVRISGLRAAAHDRGRELALERGLDRGDERLRVLARPTACACRTRRGTSP